MTDLDNLLGIVVNPLVDPALRQSSLEEIVESLVSRAPSDEEVHSVFVPKVIRQLKSELTG